MQRIYLDANATTPALPEVIEAMRPYWAERFGNASSVHGEGRRARAALEGARDAVAKLIGGKAGELTFTSGGTESDNLALFGILRAGDHVIVSAIEHDAVLHAADALERFGVRVTRVGCDGSGVVHPDAVRDAMTPGTRLVSVMIANNETGAIQPVAEIAEVVHSAGALLHTDAVQGCGKIPVDVVAMSTDLLTISAHKMHGPQGVGALWVRTGVKLERMQHGGGHERGRRSGTENVAGIAGFGCAARLAQEWMAAGGEAKTAALRDSMEAALRERISDFAVNGEGAARVPNTSSMRFAGASTEELVIALDLNGIAVSGGSACQSGTTEPSHVLRAMGLPDAEARSSIRVSLSRLTTAEEVAHATDVLVVAVEQLRSVSRSRM